MTATATATATASETTPWAIPPRHGPHISYEKINHKNTNDSEAATTATTAAAATTTTELAVDGHSVAALAREHGTPFYVYSLPAILAQYHRIRAAFEGALEKNNNGNNTKKSNFSVHFAVKSNSSLAVMRALAAAGSGMDCVSANEVRKALLAGCAPADVVLAGVGKSRDELRDAVTAGVGCINCENVFELEMLETLGEELGLSGDADDDDTRIRVALRLNPDVVASTHPSIATGHRGAKFGLSTDVVREILAGEADSDSDPKKKKYPRLRIVGLHVHIGSQLHCTAATVRAVAIAADLLRPYPGIRALNIGGGFPVPYDAAGAALPEIEAFAAAVAPLVAGFDVSVEPGRYVIARAGLLVSRVLYRKEQDGRRIAICDASMVELMRPALYNAVHACVHVDKEAPDDAATVEPFEVVGPVCETTDVLASEAPLDDSLVAPGCLVAFCTAGAYCSTMGGNYNARQRPPELVVTPNGADVVVARRRETFESLVRDEVDISLSA